jgi:16S rRNA (cytidine1402-2'-O)-methyltransferase
MNFGKFIIAGNQTGNPEDIPPKSLEAIKNATHIFCDHLWLFKEDISDFHKIDISKKYIKETGQIYDEVLIAEEAVSILKKGHDVIFITDSGLPGFADKGMRVTDFIYSQGIKVEIIPGPTVSGVAIAVAGLPSSAEQNYCVSFFNYSLNRKREILTQIKDFSCTTVVLCHPEEVKENIDIGLEIFGQDRIAAICKNISMPSQEIFRGSLKELKKKNLFFKNCRTAIVFQGK